MHQISLATTRFIVRHVARCLLLSLTALSAQAQAGVAIRATAADTSLVRRRARAAIETYEAAWLRSWVISTANRHPIVGTSMTRSMRATHQSGAIVHTPYINRPGFVYDTLVTKEPVPESRAEVSRCAQRTTIMPIGLDRTTTVGEYVSANPVFGPRLAFRVAIPSHFTGFAVCPTWYLGPDSVAPWEERNSLDAALDSRERTNARMSRAKALSILRELIAAEATDSVLWGQLARLAVDQGESARALEELQGCAANSSLRSWCELLRGYVWHASGDVYRAEQAFRAGVDAAANQSRCEWADMRPLIDASLVAQFQNASCATRDSLALVYWWLSDPAWADSRNERWTEQMARAVLLSLRTTYGRDERFDWRDTVGGDARREMVLRYGWPSFVYWRGLTSDTLLVSQLRLQPDRHGMASAPNVPFTSYEYQGARVHMSPSASALLAPFDADASAWSLNAPVGGDRWPAFRLPQTIRDPKNAESPQRNAENENYTNRWREFVYTKFVDSTLWWPQEHAAMTQRFVQLPYPQVAFLRRDTSIIVGIAQSLPALNEWTLGTRIPAVALVTSRGPHNKHVSLTTAGTIGSHVTLRDSIAAKPTMIGVEFARVDSLRTLARTRFGVRPPPTLSELRANETAISDPIVLSAPRRTTISQLTADSALNSMAPTTTVVRSNGFAVYWETYGVRPEDSLTVVLRVIPSTAETVGQSFASRLFRRDDRSAPIRITWRENGSTVQQRYIIPGRVPIVGRSIGIQTSQLKPGDYWVELGVERTNGETLQRRVRISISK